MCTSLPEPIHYSASKRHQRQAAGPHTRENAYIKYPPIIPATDVRALANRRNNASDKSLKWAFGKSPRAPALFEFSRARARLNGNIRYNRREWRELRARDENIFRRPPANASVSDGMVFPLSLSSPPTSRGVCPSLFVGCFRAFFLPSPAPIVSARVRKTDRIFFRPDLLDSRGSGSCVKFLLAGRFFFRAVGARMSKREREAR